MPLSFNVDDYEQDLLSRILTDHLGDLRMEIANTDSAPMRQDLHREEEAIKAMIERLKNRAATGG